MRRLFLVAAGLALVAALGVGYAGAQDYGQGQGKNHGQGLGKKSRQAKSLKRSQSALTAYLTGQAEISEEGDDGAGDPNAKGTASFLVADEQTLCYGFAIRGADEPTGVHIHRGKAGRNGDIVIPFANPPKDANGQPPATRARPAAARPSRSRASAMRCDA